MKKTVVTFCITALAVACVSTLSAQGLTQFRAQLAYPSGEYNSRVVVTEHGSAAAAVGSMAHNASARVSGFRICIFFDNSQQARNKAQQAIRTFEESFPDVPTYPKYESPNFKVNVGNCLTYEEALMLMGRVQTVFPNPFIAHEDIPVSLFGERYEAPEMTETGGE